jgi:hypothetical protein
VCGGAVGTERGDSWGRAAAARQRREYEMVERTTGRAGTARRHPVRTAALVVGAVFLLVGVLGFIPG